MKVFKDDLYFLLGIIVKVSSFFTFALFIRKLGVEGAHFLIIKLLSLFLIVVSLTQEGAISRYFIFTENVH